MRNLQIPLRVHSWGGLGSQLFGVILYLELKENFPRRKIILCLHEGGVTLRNSEIRGIFRNVLAEEIKDYSKSHFVSQEKNSGTKGILRNQMRRLMIKSKVLLTLDDSTNINSVKPWTVSIRGHYSYREITRQLIDLFLSNLTTSGLDRLNLEREEKIQLGIHYRLGDLIELSTKQPMKIERLAKVIKARLDENPLKSLVVFSDSPDRALSQIQDKFPDLMIAIKGLPTWETIGALLNSKSFVGTFSKVSLWVVILRYLSNEMLPSYMPIESRQNLELLLGNTLDPSMLFFYD